MTVYRPTTAAIVALLGTGVFAHGGAARYVALDPGVSTAAVLRAEGLDVGYNLDYDTALATFDRAIAADPTDPAPYRLAAGSVWVSMLFAQGAVTADDYLG